ncbi:MAG: hypothetical protein NVSMB46_07740 [Candidatus Saccharimonadales bacterium]
MEIKNNLAYLSLEEENLTHLTSPVEISSIPINEISDELHMKAQILQNMLMADDHELTHDQRGMIVPSLERLGKKEKLLHEMMMCIFRHECQNL